MSKAVNDLVGDKQKFMAELQKQLVVTTGYDRPRYINLFGLRTGDLGLMDLGYDWRGGYPRYWNRATGTKQATGGTLEDGFYCAMVVGVDKRIAYAGEYRKSNPTIPSTAVECDAGTSVQSIVWTIPAMGGSGRDSQLGWDAVGTHTGGAGTTLTDSTVAWIVDQWVGYSVRNIETGEVGTVSANTAATLTSTIAWSTGDRYQIGNQEVQAREIFVSQGDTAAEAYAGPFRYAATLNDNSTTSWTMTAASSAAIFPDYERYEPPNFKLCIEAYGYLWGVSGISESRGYAKIDRTGTGCGAVEVTVMYDDGLGNRIARYTTAAPAPTGTTLGSCVTVTGCTGANIGNNVTGARILQVDSVARQWFEILNPDAVTSGGSISGSAATVYPQIVTGTGTYWRRGMEGGQFGFVGEATMTILSVDEAAQTLMLGSFYEGDATDDTEGEYSISSSYSLYRSNFRDPHAYASDAVIPVDGEVTAIAAVNGNVLLCTETKIYRMNHENLSLSPQIASDHVGCPAPFSVVTVGSKVYFYDGYGFSVTDGFDVQSLSQYKLRDLMESVNPDMKHNVRGVFDPEKNQIEWVFPLDTSVTNDYGVIMNVSTGDFYPMKRKDVNCLWREKGADGIRRTFHGTTTRHNDSGVAYVWMHSDDMESDGLAEASEHAGVITSVADLESSGFFVVRGASSDFVIDSHDNEGIPFVIEDGTGTVELHGVVRKMEVSGLSGGTDPESYDVYPATDYPTTGIALGQRFFLGSIPFVYGPKWVDFDSPRYLHQPYELHIDCEPCGPLTVYVDFFKNGIPTIVQTVSRELSLTDTKAVVPYTGGTCHSFGFRIRCYTNKRLRIQNMSIIYGTLR